MNEDMLYEKIQNRIEELKEKIQLLVEERDSLSKRIEEINIELTKIVGGITELNSLSNN